MHGTVTLKSAGLLFISLLACVLLSGCAKAPQKNTDSAQESTATSTYATDIRWTSYGIPHVKADDWGSLGYGFAYATATDAICVIARDVVMVNGEQSRYFGAQEGNLESDIFHRAILTDAKLIAYNQAQSDRAHDFSAGYVAGYNRYLNEHSEKLPASCVGQPWVRQLTGDDLTRLAIGVGIRYGLGRFQKEIANAAPVQTGQELASTQWSLPAGIGSNAVAIGRALSTSKRGILLGNPHYPWHGSSRFHLIHTTIPGELDVMGTSLLNTTRVAIGFNQDIAWTHTVSTALRFTLYRLDLVAGNGGKYQYDGEQRAIEARTVMITDQSGKATPHTVYFTHFGPIIENKEFPWTDKHAYALRDAVIDNYATADTYDAMNKATTTAELEAAISQQGVYWTNTIAADRHGNAFFADISGTPNVDQALLDRCRITHANDRLFVLNGNSRACEWHNDRASKVPGALPPADMPRMTVDTYVTNSNDSYWLSNPNQPLEGYSPIIGPERTARSLRTRAGLTQMGELVARNERIAPADIQNMLYNQRNFGAELLLDDVLAACTGVDSLIGVCDVLKQWDRTGTTQSVGGHVWREFWDQARMIENLYSTPFDANDPVSTPRGVNTRDPAVKRAVLAALTHARDTLTEAGIALDAVLADIQYAPRNGKRIPIPGGEGWAGMFSMIVTELTPEGYTPIIHGNSYIQVISWDEAGNLDPRAMLAYSQSPEPESDHYSDLTELYAAGGWIKLPFTDAEIAADPNLQHLRLVE